MSEKFIRSASPEEVLRVTQEVLAESKEALQNRIVSEGHMTLEEAADFVSMLTFDKMELVIEALDSGNHPVSALDKDLS